MAKNVGRQLRVEQLEDGPFGAICISAQLSLQYSGGKR